MTRLRQLLLLCFTLLPLLSGCFDNEDIVAPEDVALQFFDAIYNQQNPEQARSLTNEQLAELFDHYQNVSNIQRHIIGMTMPGHPTISVEVKNSTADFFRRFNKTVVDVEVRFSSEADGRQYYDNRTVRLKLVAHRYWVITEILSDPFVTNG